MEDYTSTALTKRVLSQIISRPTGFFINIDIVKKEMRSRSIARSGVFSFWSEQRVVDCINWR